jgi:GxxExxY protein
MQEDPAYVDEDEVPNIELNRITNAIIGAAIDVHKALGPGFRESVYEEALAIAFNKRAIRFSRQHGFVVEYEGQIVGTGRVDFVVEEKVIVEIKAIDTLGPVHTAQAISYMRATRLPLAILINFNVKRMVDGIKRVAL